MLRFDQPLFCANPNVVGITCLCTLNGVHFAHVVKLVFQNGTELADCFASSGAPQHLDRRWFTLMNAPMPDDTASTVDTSEKLRGEIVLLRKELDALRQNKRMTRASKKAAK